MEIKRPLKRNYPKLGPPDIYPQDPKQKEDELTTVNVKQGYTSAPLISGPEPLDEFGSAKDAKVDAFGVYFSALLSEKHRINTIKDTQKKKQLVNTKEIWYVHAKTKNAVDNWFRDLANGTKSLNQLGKRIPIFNSKEGMFSQLYESHVPLAKAIWFIKMSAVHAIALSESSSKSKKRQVPDQYQELTSALTKYLKDILMKMFECYQQSQQQNPQLQQQSQQSGQTTVSQGVSNNPQSILAKLTTSKSASSKTAPLLSGSNGLQQHNSLVNSTASSLLNHQTSFTTNLHTSIATLMTSHTASAASLSFNSAGPLHVMHEDFMPTYNQWQYQTQLARYLFDEGLLDRYDFLCFLLELIEKKRPTNDLVVKLICPLILEYVIEFSRSAVLSRRLAHICAKKLCQALHHHSMSNSLYRNAIYILSSILQVICIECPTAMVRHHIVDAKFPPMFQGSPLDHLPCLPSNLPMMESDLNPELRRSVHEAEREILYRSAMADSKWSCYSTRKAENSKATLVSRLLTVLDTLDKHNFDKIDSVNSYDTLYSKIFPSFDYLNSKTNVQTGTSEVLSGVNTSTNLPVEAVSTSFYSQLPGSEHTKKSKHNQNANVSSSGQQSIDHMDGISYGVAHEEHVIKLLCEWATTTQRTGEHRALIVARLLERRQAELQTRNQENRSNYLIKSKKIDDLTTINPSSESSNAPESNEQNQSEISKEDQQEDIIEYVFQGLLVQFLDENAPVIQENRNDNPDIEKAFNNLVLLFSELIRCDVFSHYNYMCTLISRGMFNELSIMDKNHGLLDNHIDDVDADLGKILQDIKEGQQDEAADILLPDYLGGLREDSSNKNTQINKLSPFGLGDRSSTLDNTTSSSSNVMSSSNFPTNPVESKSIGITSIADEKTSPKNQSEYRHLTFVKHFPVPDEENFVRDINQRNILLYGFGKEREEARHATKKLNKEICKLLSRRASRDINDGGKIKKFATREVFNPEATIHKFESLNHHDQHVITNSLSATMLEMFTGVSNGQTFSLPTLESVSFIFDLFNMASNVSGLLELVVPILEELPDVEAQIKLKCPLLANQYTHSIALCIVGMLYRYHSCVLLLSKDELCSIFESLHKLVSCAPNPGVCMTSAERVILCYLYDLYSSQTSRLLGQYSSLMQKIKQQLQNVTSLTYNNNIEHEWTSTFLSSIVNQLRTSHLQSNSSNNPILNASSSITSMSNFSPLNANDLTTSIRQQLYLPESLTIRQMNEMPSFRYRFVCDAIYLSATSTYPDLVNDIAVLCADVTSKCPALMNDWIQALQALFCSAQRELIYRQILNKINISEPQVMDNIAIFTAILVARRCIQLDEFIIKCAIGAILAPLGSVDKHLTEPGVRLTCHLLLTLFRNRESPPNQSRCNQAPLYNSHSAFGQTFPNYGNNTPSYSGGLLDAVPHMGLLQTLNKESDGSPKTPLGLKYLCDHHLLRSACCNIKTECHITLLKAIRVLAMLSSPNNEAESHGRVKVESHFDDISMDGLNQVGRDGADMHDGSPGMLNSESGFNPRHTNLQTASLHQFADAILRLLCSQRWLHDKCLVDSEIFTTTDPDKNILLDPRIDVKQSQRLLYMICYNKSPEMQADIGLDDQGSDQVASIVKMFENLDVWTMRLSLMRLQFMFAYCKSQSNVTLNDWLDNLAKAVVDFFQKASQENESQDKDTVESNDGSKKGSKTATKLQSTCSSMNSSVTNINKVWLIEPLLDKLAKPPSAVQSKIIKASASLMESASVRANSLPSLNQTYLSTAAASTKFKERTLSQRGSASTNPSNLASTSLLGFQPFLSLLMSCLKNQDKERETLLTSLNSQLYQAIHEKVDDIGYKQSLQDGLELRLCLIGQMFDTIQKSPNLTSDWATLLLLLIMNNLVDPQLDYGLYVSVLDMLATLIHSAYASDPIEQKEEAKKQYQNLMKKFRKELAALEEKGFIQMKLINPLMPLVRQMTEVITCEPMGSLVDTKGEKVDNFLSIDSKTGLKVSELQEVSAWDLIEGHKNPAPLCWPWFGAIKLEHKPLRADENNRLMSWHTHTVRYNTSYYCQVPTTDDGPSSAKRTNAEKKPSQSNPLLKSLIEANDESSPLIRKENDASGRLNDDDALMSRDMSEDHFIARDDLLEDYCELPVDLLFDSTPIETMIDDIKTAMQAEHAVIASRTKPPQMVDTKPILGSASNSQASSILAPVQSDSYRSTTPQVSALSALQNHLNASSSSAESSSIMVNSGPASIPPPISMSPSIQPQTPDLPIPVRPSSSIVKVVPVPSPIANRSMSPMVSKSPAIAPTPTPPPPKPKAPRKKRTTKKDQINAANANVPMNPNANLPVSLNKNSTQINMMPSTVAAYAGNSMDTMNHAPTPQMVINQQKLVPNSQQPGQMQMHQLQQQAPPGGMMVRRGQFVQASQQPQQQPSVYDFQPYQAQPPPQPSNQFVNSGSINNYYEQQQHLQQHQHHQLQYQQQVQHPHQHQHAPQQQQHIQPQQIRLAGHQQAMSFQPMQQHQHPQQQIFAPQQAAGHSRPALTAMLHQKHAAAGNMDNKMHQPQPRFNFG